MAEKSEQYEQASEFQIVDQPISRQDSVSNFDDIAQILIQEKFILTALEFYAELLENGVDLPRLRDYFSNPGNFERNVDVKGESYFGLPRTASIQTFDSLDFARFSDDEDRQNDKLAVLEFELRKAQEMIKSLRANLTDAAESESTTDNYPEYVLEDDSIKLHESRALNYLVNEYLLKYNYKLTSITFSDENSNQDFEDWDDVGLNIPKPPTLLSLYREYGRNSKPISIQVEVGVQVNCETVDMCTMVEENLFSDRINVCDDTQMSRSINQIDTFLETIEDTSLSNCDVIKTSNMEKSPPLNISKLPVNLNVRSGEDQVDDTAANIIESFKNSAEGVTKEAAKVAENIAVFHQLLKDLTTKPSVATNDRLAFEICEIHAVNSSENVVLLLARCLPHIVPNVILSRREELLPVILSTISLHPEASERDKLLNILFNLIKRPDDDQRQMILEGFVAIAQLIGSARVENELLPQCWEQIGHKYPERRLLVAEACGVLIPYITNEMKSSLILSMLQQMLNEEKIDLVRNSIVQSLAVLFAYMHDCPKYTLGMNLLSMALHDKSETVSKIALRLFLPAFSFWSKQLDKLQTHLVPEVLHQINGVLDKTSHATAEDGKLIIHLVEVLLGILPWIFVLVIENVPSNIDSDLHQDFDVDRLPPFVSPLCKLEVIVGDLKKCNNLIKSYEAYTSQEWYESWNPFQWITKSFLPELFGLIKRDHLFTQEQTHALCQLFYWFNRMFGRSFVTTYIKPSFKDILKFRDQDKENIQNRTATIQIAVPVYVCGVLAALSREEDRQEIAQFLREVLMMLSLCHLPLKTIEFVIIELRSDVGYHDLLLSVLWDGVVHSSPLVRSNSASLFQLLVGSVDEHILATKIAPALMALANDPEISVKISTVQIFGSILEKSSNKELLAKVETQFQTFLDDPLYKDQFELRKEIIRTLGQVAPISDHRFRNEFVLPHLVALANCNNQLHQELKRTEIALAILEALLAISGFCTDDKIIQELVIPGLRCLLRDVQELAPDHEEIVVSLISEFTSKVSSVSAPDRLSAGVTAVVTSGVDEVKNRVGKIFTNRSMNKPNIQNIFSSRRNN